jgi:NADH dehydrogenase
MAVMVTGASGVVGRAVIPALVGRDPEVRAYVRRYAAAEELRALGAKVAVGRADDLESLTEVLHGVFTVVHLVGGVNQSDDAAIVDANLRSVRVALDAARAAKVRRFVLVSAPAADPEAAHPFLRAKGIAEQEVSSSGLEFAIVRSTHVYGVGGLWFTAMVEAALETPPLVVAPGDQEVAPVLVDDLAAVIAAIDDAPDDPTGTFAIEGPDVVTATRFVRLLGGEAAEPELLTPDDAARALRSILERSVTIRATELFAMPSRADAPDAAERFGVAPTGLVEGLRLTLRRADELAGRLEG